MNPKEIVNVREPENSVREKVTSLDLYLKFQPEQIVETLCLEDVGAGIYPSYYMKYGNKLKVSTSAVSLIIDSGTFQPNHRFRCPDFLKEQHKETDLGFRIARKLNKHFGTPMPKEADSWYVTWETIDKRIKKLKAFQKVTFADSLVSFKPDFILRDNALIIDRSAYHITQFIQGVEKVFPDYNHVVLTSGMDSQLICLTPKLNEKN